MSGELITDWYGALFPYDGASSEEIDAADIALPPDYDRDPPKLLPLERRFEKARARRLTQEFESIAQKYRGNERYNS